MADLHKLAYMLFCCDNPPGTTEISGAQDTICLVFPGLARSDYHGDYWPHHIEHLADESALCFVEELLYLVPLGPRHDDFDVLSDTCITPAGARTLAEATDDCWQVILDQDVADFGQAVRCSFEAQVAILPRVATPTVLKLIDCYWDVFLGWKLPGAGGRGYLVLVADNTHRKRDTSSSSARAGEIQLSQFTCGKDMRRLVAWYLENQA